MTDEEKAELAQDCEELRAGEEKLRAAREKLLAFARRTKEWKAYEFLLTMDMLLLKAQYMQEWLQRRGNRND